MNKLQLVVAVREADYAQRLADYIRHSAYGESWQLTAFTNPNALRQFIRAGYPVDLLAVHASMAGELGEASQHVPTAILVTSPEQATECSAVLQFQPIPRLLQSLLAIHAAGTGGGALAERGNRRTSVAAVCSAVGGIGKTTMALQLAQQAGGRGANVFYLNLEQWNATSISFGDEGGEDFSRMLYSLQAEPEKAKLRLAELRRRHPAWKLDYFAPCGNVEERLSMSAEDAESLIAAVAENGQYDLVVIDTDCRFDPVYQAVLESADTVIWMIADNPNGRRKTSLAFRYGEQKWGQSFRDWKRKFRFVAVSAADDATACTFDSELKIRIDGMIPAMAAGGLTIDAGGRTVYRGAVEALIDRFRLLERG